MIDCIELSNYALTGHYSRYLEDSLTAQNLLMRTAKKTRECVNIVDNLTDAVALAYVDTVQSYDPATEELAVAEVVKISLFKGKTSARWYILFNENAKSFIELTGNVNKAVNECLKELEGCVTHLKTLLEHKTLDELQQAIDNAYIEVYDDCSFTALELAGTTANNVNCLIDIINSLETFLENGAGISYTEVDETIITSLVEDEDEIIKI